MQTALPCGPPHCSPGSHPTAVYMHSPPPCAGYQRVQVPREHVELLSWQTLPQGHTPQPHLRAAAWVRTTSLCCGDGSGSGSGGVAVPEAPCRCQHDGDVPALSDADVYLYVPYAPKVVEKYGKDEAPYIGVGGGIGQWVVSPSGKVRVMTRPRTIPIAPSPPSHAGYPITLCRRDTLSAAAPASPRASWRQRSLAWVWSPRRRSSPSCRRT